MPDEKSVDVFNEPVAQAANRAFEQLQSFLRRMPNPPGYAAKKSQLSSADIDRLIKGD
jgi:hypothetical protein